MSSDERNELTMQSNVSLANLMNDSSFTESGTTFAAGNGWRVEFETGLPRYDITARCGVCRSGFVTTKYKKVMAADEDRRVVTMSEYMERTCERCDYSWREAKPE